MKLKRVLVLVMFAMIAGCTTEPTVEEGNYLTFDHEFTDRAAQKVQRRAEAICSQRGQVTEKVSSTCSLTRCVTNYQCIGKPPADKRGAKK